MSLEFKTINEAYEEAGRRLNDAKLQNRVAAFLGNVWPLGFDEVKNPRAVFAPYLAKGSELEIDFLRLVQASGFDSTVATYADTEYVTANPGVVDCYRPSLKLPKGQRSRQWVVPESQRRGQLKDAQTIYGSTIVDYWMSIREVALEVGGLPVDDARVDLSEWYRVQAERFGCTENARSRSPYYYRALMGLYASGRAVLFDTPPTTFAAEVMEPAARLAQDELGVEPLLTLDLQPGKRDWIDLEFLDQAEVQNLLTNGKIA